MQDVAVVYLTLSISVISSLLVLICYFCSNRQSCYLMQIVNRVKGQAAAKVHVLFFYLLP